MSELVNNKKYNFAELAKKHNNFLCPSYIIKIGEKDLVSELGYVADGIEIMQTISDKSGSLKFSICNAYDIKSHSFKSGLKNTFALGQTVQANLGYNQPMTLFKGFIGDISFSFSEGSPPKATISCLDIRALMKQGKNNAMPADSKFYDVTKKLLRYYTSLVTMNIKAADDFNDEKESFHQKGNDFDFIYNFAQKRGYEFFVLGSYVYFIKKEDKPTPIITLEWGESILSFSRSYSYKPTKTTGALSGSVIEEPFDDTSKRETTYPSLNLTSEPIVHALETSDEKTPQDLKAVLEQHKSEAASGTIKCIGLPELVPRRFVSIKNLDGGFLDDDYYIDTVTHSFSSSGYTTSLGISTKNASAKNNTGNDDEKEEKSKADKEAVNSKIDMIDDLVKKVEEDKRKIPYISTGKISAKKLQIKLDDEKTTITLSEPNSKNKLTINGDSGEIEIVGDKNITLKCGTAKMTLTASGNKVDIAGDSINVKANQNLTLEGQQVKLKGQMMNVEAGGQLEVKSSGVANIKGTMVKIN